MELNIQTIADEKIRAMHESGEIKERIEKGISKTIYDAIDSAISSYKISNMIQNAVTESVSSVVAEVGFSAYNGFIAQTIKEITEVTMRDDIAKKIQKVFDDMLISKHDGIKLSEIFDLYRENIKFLTVESDQYEYRRFVCDLDQKEDGLFTWYTVRFHPKGLDAYEDPDIEFRILVLGEESKAKITSLTLDGDRVDKKLVLGRLGNVQTLLANLYFNETEIILDIDDVCDDNSYDINY